MLHLYQCLSNLCRRFNICKNPRHPRNSVLLFLNQEVPKLKSQQICASSTFSFSYPTSQVLWLPSLGEPRLFPAHRLVMASFLGCALDGDRAVAAAASAAASGTVNGRVASSCAAGLPLQARPEHRNVGPPEVHIWQVCCFVFRNWRCGLNILRLCS